MKVILGPRDALFQCMRMGNVMQIIKKLFQSSHFLRFCVHHVESILFNAKSNSEHKYLYSSENQIRNNHLLASFTAYLSLVGNYDHKYLFAR
jgi:hypothetical protein